MENTAVSAVDEKPIFACHTAYKGVGTLLAKMVVKIAISAALIATRRLAAVLLFGDGPDIFLLLPGKTAIIAEAAGQRTVSQLITAVD
tara:strand:- start:1342 stop:1605 length:264 start_codon:yes stop_codon:yes gene_type:complete